MRPKESDKTGETFIAQVAPEKEHIEEPSPQSCGIIIFGATGDLTQRKLIPALFHLFQGWLLPDRWYVLGVGRKEISHETFRDNVRKSLDGASRMAQVPTAVWETFGKRFYYATLSDLENPKAYATLKKELAALDQSHQTGGNRIFYLATPPGLYSKIVHQLGRAGLSGQGQKRAYDHGTSKQTPRTSPKKRGSVRLIVEKPFGTDLDSAQALNAKIRAVFGEEQLYRIDHYLGKEAVQNTLFLRFANAIFEPVWNRRYIDHIQITAAETLGVENRAGYYESAGALRDMFQNHLLQLLCLVAMEAPTSFESERIRDEKVKVLRSVRPINLDQIDQCAIRGQYGQGLIDGTAVEDYRKEPGVAARSKTETFAALKFYIDNWRWQGVPFYLRSGKRMAKKSTEIVIVFKEVPHLLFNPMVPGGLESNTLVLSVQPTEGIALTFQAKYPGPKFSVGRVTMDFNYRGAFQSASPDAYERLLLDCMAGDQMLFSRGDWIERSWSLLMPLLNHWEKTPAPCFPNYPSGSFGPKEADDLIQRDGRAWRSP
ncbi:MAG: glucose-6-phosphate dehydrogenase [Nitrospiria bacterium]